MTYTYLDCLAFLGVGGAHPGGLQLTKNILAEERFDETTSILDVGCGTGQTSAYIAANFSCYVTSLDCNEIMLDKARQRFACLQFPIQVKHGNTEALPFNDASFDIILSESVTSFTNVSLTIPEYKRVLKPNGVLLAIEMVLERTISEEEVNQIVDFYRISQLLTESKWHVLSMKFKIYEIFPSIMLNEKFSRYGKDVTLEERRSAN